MKSIKTGSEGNGVSSEGTEEAAAAPAEPIDFSKVEIEPLFKDFVDFETFSKSDFRAVKVLECEAVPKSKKLLKFGLDDGTDQNRVILSGIHAFYEPEQLIGKTLVAIINLPPRAMMAALRKQKPWGCFHLSDKAGKWPPSLLERTFDGQRTASGYAARCSDKAGKWPPSLLERTFDG